MKVVTLAATVVVIFVVMPLAGQHKGQETKITAGLEKQLWSIEQQWLQAEHDKRTDFLKALWTDQFFDVFPGGQPITRDEMLNLLSKSSPKPGTGAFPDDFKLRAVYGNVALATDRTVLKNVDANGQLISREIRSLRMFVNENGKWKVAGAALIPINQ